MSESSTIVPTAPSRPLPRSVLVGGGLLSLVAAALAGALVMKSVDQPAATVAAAGTPVTASTTAPTTASATAPTTAPIAPPAAPPVTAPAPNGLVGQPVPANPAGAAPTAPPAPKKNAPPAVALATQPAQHAVCATCGVVESVTAVKQKGPGTGLGAVAGGVVGGVVGHQLGGGTGKTALTVLGAVGGGFAGHEVEKRARSTTVCDVRIRMDDGSSRVLQRPQAIAVGTPVTVSGSTLRVERAPSTSSPSQGATRTIRTSTGDST